MRWLAPLALLCTFCIFVLAAPAAWAQQEERTVTVARVVDGDTIVVRPAVSGTESVRLLSVDTPETVDPNEPVQPYGPQASNFTKKQLQGKRVVLTFDQEKTDQYDRALAYVRIQGQKRTFNETLLRGGYAQLYIVSPNDRYEAQFRRAQQQARSQQRGIWGLSKAQQCKLANRGNGIGEGSPGCTGRKKSGGPDPVSPVKPDKDCSDYPSQKAAQAVLRRDPSDPYGLDGPIGRNSTGIPGVACESNPPPKDLHAAQGYDHTREGTDGGGNPTSPVKPGPPSTLPPTGGQFPGGSVVAAFAAILLFAIAGMRILWGSISRH